ncbi:2-oxoglutarate (2OG) and Fe(II)-dependent oxygenase superfamily protein [Striga asiatica]|uniref:2-oxoglutarate (2OG) and Fe(II)-dependent oxygenase superfamily protein n=1 Tax=Striga asiatica TaxID=4170 RepID=A0A5A7R6C9_STRAF|nr:2-oxoglutarate (2OG) and Fe(II)-dependent oxygenase superfamily protein [Striga asiatica]
MLYFLLLNTMISLFFQNVNMEKSSEPPLEIAYKSLLKLTKTDQKQDYSVKKLPIVEEYSAVPLIDLRQLDLGDSEKKSCANLISKASREWGFFQVVNHGIPHDLLEMMRLEQVKLFKKPFEKKKSCKDLNFSAGSYRWGSPSATMVEQLSWSEAFHVPLSDVLDSGRHDSLSSTMEKFASAVFELAQTLADILAEEIGRKTRFFKETCVSSSCYLRLNRYLPCPIHPHMFGIMPHTDSSFLTVLHQDKIGGLQLVQDGKWIAVKPNSEALVINIGDLFQAWSNGFYKSVEHRVVVNPVNERFSTAYFFCPSHDTIIQSEVEPSIYRGFTFGEFMKQVQKDVQIHGHKVGLSRFLVSTNQ